MKRFKGLLRNDDLVPSQREMIERLWRKKKRSSPRWIRRVAIKRLAVPLV
jgi:hypothetical protein